MKKRLISEIRKNYLKQAGMALGALKRINK